MNNKQNPDWYRKIKKGPMENRKDEEEFISKIKQSIYKNNEVDFVKHKRPFRKKSITYCSCFSLYNVIFHCSTTLA